MKLVHVVEEGTDGASKFLCPVFMNMARQVCTFHLPMTAGDTAADMWTLAGTAIILDRGTVDNNIYLTLFTIIHGVGMETVYVCMWQGSDSIHTHNQPIKNFL